MTHSSPEPWRQGSVPAAAGAARAHDAPHPLLGLLHWAGNAVVSALLAGQPAGTSPAPAPMPSTETLIERITRCIGVWETNRGGEAPEPQESRLDTVAGVKASMATVEQATMPYALDALRRSSALRRLADPELTQEEVRRGDRPLQRCQSPAACGRSGSGRRHDAGRLPGHRVGIGDRHGAHQR